MRWGIAGYGWVARDYMAPGIRAAGGTVAAICDPSPDARSAAEADGVKAHADLGAMLEEGGIDALYIATPNHLHETALALAIEASIPTLCEKPLAHDGSAVDSIAAIVARRDPPPLGVAFDQRHHPAHEAMKEQIASGAIGQVTAIRIVYCCWVDPEWSRGTGSNWRAERRCAGGGAVLDLAPHGVDLAHYLLGEPVDDLNILLQRRVHDYAVEDGGMATGRTASGVLFSSHTSYNWPEELPRRRLEVAGTKGMIVASDTMGQDAGGHMTMIDATNGTRREVVFDTATSPFTRQAAAFAEYARNGGGAFSIERDIAAARRFFTAYEKAQSCL